MDRKGIIAITLSILALIAWMYWNTQETQKLAVQRAQAQAAALEAQAREQPVEPEKPIATTAPAPATAPAAPTEAAVVEQITPLSTPQVDYSFSNLGGGISRALLRNHEAERGTKMTLNEFGSVPIGAVTEAAGEGARVPFTATTDAAGVITFERTDARQLRLSKRFSVPAAPAPESEYLVKLEVVFTNAGDKALTVPAYYVHAGSAAPVHQADLPTYTGFKWTDGKFIDVTWFDSGWTHPERPVFTASQSGIAWAAVADQYFATIIAAQADAADPAAQAKQRGASVWAKRFLISDETWKTSGRSVSGKTVPRHGVDGALGMPAFTLEPGQSLTQHFTIYTGPREYSRLRQMAQGEEEVMDFGMFGIVSKTLLNSMNWLHGQLGSYALAIIVLTLVIKSLLWPLQNKATNSMKRMQLLTPKMTELREKYKDDPAKMNTEVMKLYKDYGVNPVGGCLPMLVQIPIFFGFYNMLGKAVELRNSRFLWVDDLSLPDTVWHIPGLDLPLNVLPLLMAVTMFWQMAISPKSGDPMQQKIFMFMPVIFVLFCYNFASALALYWTVQNLFSVVQLYLTRNQQPPVLQKVAAPAKKK